MPRLAGKVAIVTGAGSGIGRACALALAREAAAVALVGAGAGLAVVTVPLVLCDKFFAIQPKNRSGSSLILTLGALQYGKLNREHLIRDARENQFAFLKRKRPASADLWSNEPH